MRTATHEQRTETQRTVAANVRAELSRERWSGRKAAEALGWTQPYLSRRLSGELPFDVNDLAAIAGLVNVPIARFFTGTRKAPAVTRTARAVSLPDLDSNQEPAVTWSIGFGPDGTRRYAITRRHRTHPRRVEPLVTPMRRRPPTRRPLHRRLCTTAELFAA